MKKLIKKRPKLLFPKGKKARGPRTYHLRNAFDCRVFLSRITNEMWRGELDPKIGGKCSYTVSIILRSIEVGDLTKRIEELEKRLEEKNV